MPAGMGSVGPIDDVPGKTWDEMNMDERIESLKRLCDQLINLTQHYNRQIDSLESELRNHRHDEKGESYIKMKPGYHGENGLKSTGGGYIR